MSFLSIWHFLDDKVAWHHGFPLLECCFLVSIGPVQLRRLHTTLCHNCYSHTLINPQQNSWHIYWTHTGYNSSTIGSLWMVKLMKVWGIHMRRCHFRANPQHGAHAQNPAESQCNHKIRVKNQWRTLFLDGGTILVLSCISYTTFLTEFRPFKAWKVRFYSCHHDKWLDSMLE